MLIYLLLLTASFACEIDRMNYNICNIQHGSFVILAVFICIPYSYHHRSYAFEISASTVNNKYSINTDSTALSLIKTESLQL